MQGNIINKQSEISVAFITDDSYVIPTATAITSLLQHKLPDTQYSIYIVSTCLTENNMELFQQFSSPSVKICVLTATLDKYLHLHRYKEQNNICIATPSALLKFELPNLLPTLKKILYLDGDIIVKKDLSSLYNTDITGYMAAAVHDTGKLYDHQRKYALYSNYFNSGVMLLNLEAMRKQNIPQKLYEAKKNSTDMQLMDQNIFNEVLNDNVKMLDITNNLLILNLKRAIKNYKITDINQLFNTNYSSLTQIEENASILHFSSKDKPWKFYDGEYSDMWNEYFKKSPFGNMPLTRKYLKEDINRKEIETACKQDKHNIIISLTSYPARIDTVDQTITTLLAQSIKADKVILWLSESQFPNKEKDLPQQLVALTGKNFSIGWYKNNIRSFTKLIPTLKQYPDAVIITADDDILYPENWLELLLQSYYTNPTAIHCHRVHLFGFENNSVLPYNCWEKNLRHPLLSYANFLTGVGGVLYPPHCLHQDTLNEEKFMELCPRADDIWFWAMAVLNNTRIQNIKYNIPDLTYIPGTQEAETCLWKTNTGEQAQNDIQLQKVLTAYPEILPLVIKDLKAIPISHTSYRHYYLFGFIPFLKVIER